MNEEKDLTIYGIDLEVAGKFAQNLTEHIEYVREAGLVLGVPTKQLKEHDLSKWSCDEFPHYADWFFGNKSQPANFERAWLHHLHSNPHHWQYWMFPDNFGLKGGDSENGILRMPYDYVLEMVADWQGASRAYAGTTNMTNWLKANLPKIKLHSETKIDLRNILQAIGYDGFLEINENA